MFLVFFLFWRAYAQNYSDYITCFNITADKKACNNNGRCVNYDTCHCWSGWRGLECEEWYCKKNCTEPGSFCVGANECGWNCSDSDCPSNAHCEKGDCVCNFPWSGENCQTNELKTSIGILFGCIFGGIGGLVVVTGFIVLTILGCSILGEHLYLKHFPPEPVKYEKKVTMQDEDGTTYTMKNFEEGIDEKTGEPYLKIPKVRQSILEKMLGKERELKDYKKVEV